MGYDLFHNSKNHNISLTNFDESLCYKLQSQNLLNKNYNREKLKTLYGDNSFNQLTKFVDPNKSSSSGGSQDFEVQSPDNRAKFRKQKAIKEFLDDLNSKCSMNITNHQSFQDTIRDTKDKNMFQRGSNDSED